jgi:hypothetical protein
MLLGVAQPSERSARPPEEQIVHAGTYVLLQEGSQYSARPSMESGTSWNEVSNPAAWSCLATEASHAQSQCTV